MERVENAVESIRTASKAIDSELHADNTSCNQILSSDAFSPQTSSFPIEKPIFPPRFKNLPHHSAAHSIDLARHTLGTVKSHDYDPDAILSNPPSASKLTLPMLLANQTHLGHATSLWHPGNSGYIFGVRDGIHIISLDITFAYLRRAAKVVTEIARRGGIILFLGTRKGWDEIVVNSAKRAGGFHIFDRWTPGSLTNGQQILGNCAVRIVDAQDQTLSQFDALLRGDKQVLRPDLVICLNPIENEVCLHECGLYNVPTIGVVDTDCNPAWVTYPIPANDDSLRSIGLIAGVLGRAGHAGQKLRLETAKQGDAGYTTKAVENYIEMLEEVQALDVNETDGGGAEASA